ncbi:hypothetical protein [Haliangium ochraceum]|uniref:DUF4175 domain-containing protein n=1 Tax=Haliangium ochraceum (strain DSM 14365 / JCM 11303 / SMP-2) TaxID=502025 RepID=D0LSH6_HALO1|nr:hypothetical protein [Haliangium ochraceum]ACY15675.1 hypothetical protein Hoch_3173 [Haliangium ochraceum DSM 14365]
MTTPALDARTRIHSFLHTVRRVVLRRMALRTGLYAGAIAVVLGAALPLLALVIAPQHGRLLGALGLALVALGAALGWALGVSLPRRRWRSDRNLARFVGRHRESLASDLLSAVELSESQERALGRGRASAELTEAFFVHTAGRLDVVAPAELDADWARRSLRRALAALGGALVVQAALLLLLPETVGQGWRQLWEKPTPGPFAGARMSPGPLVGDMQITLEYPAYTQRPRQVLPASSGDFAALPGTQVTLETRALVPVRGGRVVFGSGDEGAAAVRAGDDDEAAPAEDANALEIGAEGSALSARFRVHEATQYRFLLEGRDGERRVESLPRRIELELDAVPTATLYAPADELDVTEMRRIELAYIAEDDYGLAEVELVWESGGQVARKALPLTEVSPRRAQNKFLWDLAELHLQPGEPVRYYLEVKDNDTVSGPKLGRSRSYVLRVFSPREEHEQIIARQRELFEKMIGNLGGRLVLAEGDVHAQRVVARDSDGLVVEIGTLLAALKDDELADAGLTEVLEGMRARLDALTDDEAAALAKVDPRQPRGGRSASSLSALNGRLVSELEDDVLTLADWLDRQSMENLLAISDEVKTHQDRLRQLFDELERTGSADIAAEIEREMRALEQRLADMAGQRGQMPEDVLDRFVNAEALPDAEQSEDCMSQVRALLAAGEAAEAREQMERCMLALDQAAEAMESSLRELREDRFSEEERRFAEMMNELSDLGEDQKELAADAEDLWERYAARADEMMRDNVDDTRRAVGETLDKLRRRLEQVSDDDLTPFAQEELEIVETRLSEVEEMLADGDIAESLSMARHAREGLEIMAEELEAALQDEADAPWGAGTRAALGKLRRAAPLARELVAELEAHTPSPEEIMSPADRRELDRLRRRQQAAGERAERLRGRVSELGGALPGEAAEAVGRGLEQAGAQMGRAAQHMRGRDPSGARHEAQGAAETLERTAEGARGAARRRRAAGATDMREEPIRIPGAEDYRAPEAFREDILEAMKREQAPEGFGEMVKRYYEELIR